MKKALITGITGQDGSYLAEFLLEKGYEVHGLIRRSSISNTGRIDHLIREDKIVLHGGDMTDSTSLVRIIGEVRPDEIYNLGAQSHVQVSFEAPEYAGDVDALGVLRILEAVRMVVTKRGDWPRPAVFIRHPHPNSMAEWKKCLRMRTPRSIPTAPMRWQNSTASGS